MAGVIAEGFTQLAHEIRKIPVDDKSIGPEALVKRVLRNCIGPFTNELFEKLESLGRHRDGGTAAEDLAPAEIENELIERQLHRVSEFLEDADAALRT